MGARDQGEGLAATPSRLDIPMSDGTILKGVRLAAVGSPAPAAVMLTPYGKEATAEAMAAFELGRIGSDLVFVDVRGTGSSGGDWDGPLAPQEIADGVELIEWVGR